MLFKNSILYYLAKSIKRAQNLFTKFSYMHTRINQTLLPTTSRLTLILTSILFSATCLISCQISDDNHSEQGTHTSQEKLAPQEKDNGPEEVEVEVETEDGSDNPEAEEEVVEEVENEIEQEEIREEEPEIFEEVSPLPSPLISPSLN